MVVKRNHDPMNEYESSRSPTGDDYSDDSSLRVSSQSGRTSVSVDSPAQNKFIDGQWIPVSAVKNTQVKASQDFSSVDRRAIGKKRPRASTKGQQTFHIRENAVDSGEMPPPSRPHASQQSRVTSTYSSPTDTEDDTEAPMKHIRHFPHSLGSLAAATSHGHLSPSSSQMPSESPESDSPTSRHVMLDTHQPVANRTRNARNDSSLFVTPAPTEQRTTPRAAGAATTDPDDDPIHRRRLKAMRANPAAHPYVRKKGPENDPENREIKRLRQHERLHWDEIAGLLNQRRTDAGKTPGFSTSAVYGRFSRVAPRIAELDGEDEFDYKDYLHYKHDKNKAPKKTGPKMPALSKADEELLVDSYEEVERERWVNVANRFKLKAGVKLSPEQVAKKWSAL